ncbi:AT-hook motif nuclear-localized protein 17-like [Senna tora]|uniref:AT-hook motif nuclear-localized protein 17-like n=1 Tax=Senna tora TaxID=362788 RepID=A0A834THF6_9FABA|nr:AT-hook motif nuclear-localized protein 17-like [Senna tora]
MSELQERERERELTVEEQENLKRSVKKIKMHDGSTTVDPPESSEHEGHSPKPMEESPIAESKLMDEIPNLTLDKGDPRSKPVRRSLWGANPLNPQSYKEKLMGINGRDKDIFFNEEDICKEEPSDDEQEVDLQGKATQPATSLKTTNSGSRFEAINDEAIRDMDIDKDLENTEEQQIIVNLAAEETKMAKDLAQQESRQKPVKNKQKKGDIQSIGSKKQIQVNQAPIHPKKTGRIPTEKGKDHTLVTSIGTKNLTTQGSKTPIKLTDSHPKAPTKHPTTAPKGSVDKDAEVEEQLRAIRLMEKQEREAGTSLGALGATHVYSNLLWLVPLLLYIMARPHGSKNKPKSQPQILFANNPSLKDSIDIMGLPPKNSPSLSSDADDHLKPKKQRGRPKGSKSKPKSHPQIFSASNPSLKDSIDVIDVPSGAGIISWLCWYSYSRQKNITVLSAFGLVSQLSILPLLTNYPHIISVPGSVPVLSLSGSIPLEITSSPSFHSLTICVPGCEGQIVYGVIGGSVVATSIVTIVIVA